MQQPSHELPIKDTESFAADTTALLEAQTLLLSEIVSGVAHDIGTPLNVISGYAESMLLAMPEDASTRKQAVAIVEQTRRVAHMIRQLLDVVRAAPSQDGSGVALDRFAGDVYQISAHMLRHRKVRGRFDAEATQGIVAGDVPRLGQALFGVLRSAAIAVGPKGQISVRTVSDGAQGTGIAIDGVDGEGATANLAALAEPGLALRDGQHAALALAGQAFQVNGGGLEALRPEVDGVASGLFVRIGMVDTAAARETGAGGGSSVV
jgi:C4-dicarboxylate-specific signal transduction histidine kinase